MKTTTLNSISQEKYGKDYNHLPDDWAEQDFVQGEYARRQKLANVKPVCSDLSEETGEIPHTAGHCRCRVCLADERLANSAPALLAACEFGVKLCVAMARDADPHINLKRGESADFDAACDALDIFRAAIADAKGGRA